MSVRYTLSKAKRRIINEIKICWRFYTHIKLRRSLYPTVIQMPITHLCNFDCVMCGMHHMINRKDFTPSEIKKILSDKLFSKIEYVGINGGEPFLRNDIVQCIEVIITTLANLNHINFISNAFFTDRILTSLKQIKEMCADRGIEVDISFSIDGINDMQDYHRGHKDAFKKANETIKSILIDKDAYVNSINVICTITKYNVARINEVEFWAKNLGVEVAYNIATENVRIENHDRVGDFSVFSDEQSRMLAQEFFYRKYAENNSERYYAIYQFIKTGKRRDICPCMYNRWVTLTPDSQIGYCATHSKNLGSALEKSAFDIFNGNIKYLSDIKKEYCPTCSHYMYGLNYIGLRDMLEDQFINTYLRG